MPTEAARLRSWAARWQALRPQVRAFYVAHLDEPGVAGALLDLLEVGPAASSGTLRQFAALWEAKHGSPPPFDLSPRDRRR